MVCKFWSENPRCGKHSVQLFHMIRQTSKNTPRWSTMLTLLIVTPLKYNKLNRILFSRLTFGNTEVNNIVEANLNLVINTQSSVRRIFMYILYVKCDIKDVPRMRCPKMRSLRHSEWHQDMVWFVPTNHTNWERFWQIWADPIK